MGFISDLFGGGAAKKAAKEQAKATREAANRAATAANYDAQAAAQQQSLAVEQRSAQQAANDLLSTPMESASVDLASDQSEDDGDLLTRRRPTRQSYQNTRSAGLNM